LCKILRNVGLILHIHKENSGLLFKACGCLRMQSALVLRLLAAALVDATRRLSDCASIGIVPPVPGKLR
jgi:hypothetical protein